MRGARLSSAMAGGLVLVLLVTGAPAAAATGVPTVGECYLVTDKQTYDDYWPGGAAVPCTGRHSLEVTASAPVPADVNSATFAQDQCDYLKVWTDLGVNQARNGIVSRPIRLEAFYFVVRQPGAPDGYICGTGPVALRGKKGAVLVSSTAPVAALTAQQKAALQFCSSAARGRTIQDPAVTVPCTSTPRWQVTRWIMWDDLYSSYPGEAVLRARASRLCGPGSVPSVPSAEAWPGGTHRSWCYKKHT